jgi:PAS domain S-box-containing protein
MGVDETVLESLATSPIAMVISNPHHPDNPIEVANSAFCELTGYAEREILGRNCRFLGGEQTDERAREQIRTAIKQERPLLIDILNYRSDGTPFRNGVMIAPQFNDDGTLAYFIGSQVDLGRDDPAAAFLDRRAKASQQVRSLPERQRQVLEGMASGLLNKQIAYQLGIAEKTVKMHRSLMLERLGSLTTAEAIRVAVEAGL